MQKVIKFTYSIQCVIIGFYIYKEQLLFIMKECMNSLERLEKSQSFETIFNIISGYGDHTAVEYSTPDGGTMTFSYAEETKRYKATAGALSKLINGTNNFIGIKLENSPDWPAIYWAILMSGNNPLLLDCTAEPPITAHLLKEAGASAIITNDPAEYEIKKLSPSEILNKVKDESYTPVWGKFTALCTSGTTGTAKIFAYDEKAICAQILSTRGILESDETGSIMYDAKKGPLKQLVFLPLHHIFGFMAVYLWFSFFGKTMVYLKDKDPKTILETCRVHHVTHFFAVPLVWNNIAQGINRKMDMADDKTKTKLLKGIEKSLKLQQKCGKKGEKRRRLVTKLFASVQKALLGTDIRFLINGGGHIIPETMKTLTAIGYPIHNGFGMTETGITSVDLSGGAPDRLDGSVGKPFSSCKYSISEDGELSISGQSIFSGRMIDGKYVARTEEWYKTGDYARLIDNKLFIEGRLKEVIINESGENVYPDELEDHFSSVSGLTQYCILGSSLNKSYEEITLVAAVEDESAQAIHDLAEKISEVNIQLPIYKQVRTVLIAKQPLPIANGIKVKRQTLKKLIEDEAFNCSVLDLNKKKLLNKNGEDFNADFKANSDPHFLEIKDAVKNIFADVLVLPVEKVGDFSHFVSDLGGDSLSAIGIITQLEDKYSITIPDTEITKAVNVYETAQMIYEKLYEGK